MFFINAWKSAVIVKWERISHFRAASGYIHVDILSFVDDIRVLI